MLVRTIIYDGLLLYEDFPFRYSLCFKNRLNYLKILKNLRKKWEEDRLWREKKIKKTWRQKRGRGKLEPHNRLKITVLIRVYDVENRTAGREGGVSGRIRGATEDLTGKRGVQIASEYDKVG